MTLISCTNKILAITPQKQKPTPYRSTIHIQVHIIKGSLHRKRKGSATDIKEILISQAALWRKYARHLLLLLLLIPQRIFVVYFGLVFGYAKCGKVIYKLCFMFHFCAVAFILYYRRKETTNRNLITLFTSMYLFLWKFYYASAINNLCGYNETFLIERKWNVIDIYLTLSREFRVNYFVLIKYVIDKRGQYYSLLGFCLESCKMLHSHSTSSFYPSSASVARPICHRDNDIICRATPRLTLFLFLMVVAGSGFFLLQRSCNLSDCGKNLQFGIFGLVSCQFSICTYFRVERSMIDPKGRHAHNKTGRLDLITFIYCTPPGDWLTYPDALLAFTIRMGRFMKFLVATALKNNAP